MLETTHRAAFHNCLGMKEQRARNSCTELGRKTQELLPSEAIMAVSVSTERSRKTCLGFWNHNEQDFLLDQVSWNWGKQGADWPLTCVWERPEEVGKAAHGQRGDSGASGASTDCKDCSNMWGINTDTNFMAFRISLQHTNNSEKALL